MKQFKNYANAQVYTAQEKLPVGGYICKILNTEIQTNSYGESLVISFDIEEGEYKGYYQKNYKAQEGEDKKWKGNYRLSVPKDDGSEQDNKVMSRFKTFIQRVEDSNGNYHWDWDEAKLKGKLIGIIFNEKEYDYEGRTGFFTNPLFTAIVEDIRKGNFKIPQPTYLKKDNAASNTEQGGNGWMNAPTGKSEEMPFN